MDLYVWVSLGLCISVSMYLSTSVYVYFSICMSVDLRAVLDGCRRMFAWLFPRGVILPLPPRPPVQSWVGRGRTACSLTSQLWFWGARGARSKEEKVQVRATRTCCSSCVLVISIDWGSAVFELRLPLDTSVFRLKLQVLLIFDLLLYGYTTSTYDTCNTCKFYYV